MRPKRGRGGLDAAAGAETMWNAPGQIAMDWTPIELVSARSLGANPAVVVSPCSAPSRMDQRTGWSWPSPPRHRVRPPGQRHEPGRFSVGSRPSTTGPSSGAADGCSMLTRRTARVELVQPFEDLIAAATFGVCLATLAGTVDVDFVSAPIRRGPACMRTASAVDAV